ncbi:MAG: nucleoside 2-deoxyribosyltransferase [Candidatus ainarchaeum sp.]|nr:nucleoside 2-deoxyribosyltransferase [Candidatus ainarchaeum sp.]
MKIYFAGSIRGGRDDKDTYLQIINHLGKYGKVLTEHIGNENLSSQGESHSEDYIYNRDMSWIKEADVIVAEVTQPSLGVGYELGIGESLGKKVYCLYRPQDGKKLSAMVGGNKYFIIKEYKTLDDAKKMIDGFFKK